MKRDSKITVAAVLSAVALFSLLLSLEWAGLDWEKWFGFVVLTLFVFGLVAYRYGESLKKPKCLLLFLGMLVLHVSLLGHYVRFARKFPAQLFFVAPFEVAAVAFILIAVGGARAPRNGAPGKRHHRADQDAKLP